MRCNVYAATGILKAENNFGRTTHLTGGYARMRVILLLANWDRFHDPALSIYVARLLLKRGSSCTPHTYVL